VPADIATLLAEAPWLARLARSLTGSAAEADDIVQETYAAALRSPPDTERPLRPWLRRVAVNLVRMRHRGGTRREANESAVEAQSDPVRTPEQLLERAQLERRLAELVLELDEPFRTTVLLRYREGLSAEQIAKQQGIPAGTVRSRLKTALDRIRRELDDREQTRMRFVFAPLAAAAKGPALAPGLWRLVMAKMTSKVAAAVLLVLALLLGGALVLTRDSASPARDERAATHRPSTHEPSLLVARPAMFAQPGIAARRVRGRVTSDGVPFRGAVVQLVHGQTEVMLAETKSGVDGTFDLGDRVADVYVVTASAQDRVARPVQIDLRAPATPELELRLAGCSHLRGSVVDGSGAAIVHARIARDGAPAPFVETDASGRYDLCTSFGAGTFRYSASGYQSVLVDVDIVTSNTRDVVLIPEATIEGKVVTVDGAPVAGAWVVIDPNDMGNVRNARATGFSAADGGFRIVGVSPGRNLIAGFAPGLRTTYKQEVVVGAGQVLDGIVVRLAPAAAIAGVVVAGGMPVPGVGVGMRNGNRDETGLLAVTQADGSFVIDRAPRGDLALYVENHTVLAPRSVHIGDRQTHVRIEVQRMGAVRGRVLRGGEPVAGAQVSCPRAAVFADATGAYLCDGVDAGPQELFADAAGGEWGRAIVTVARGETSTVDIPLTFSAAICGQLVDEGGAPIPGLEVRVAERTTGDFGKDTSGIDGEFCARKLTGGAYDVSVYAGPRVLEPLAPLGALTLGPKETKHVTLAVPAPRLAITGTVSDPQGAPVVDAIVRVVDANKLGQLTVDSRAPSSVTLTDDAGRFSLTRLAAGDYTIIASARDGSEVITSPVAAGTRDVTITLAAAGRIEGQLVGFASTPTITGVLMTFTRMPFDAEVDGTRFRATGLSPGTYVLMAVTDAREADTQQVVVRPGETSRVTLTSRGTGTVVGVARDFRTRAPVPGLRCATLARQGDTIGAIYTGPDEAVPTDAQGAFRLTSSAGEINLLCMNQNRSGSRTAVAARDRTTTVDVLTVAITQVPGTIDASFEELSRRIHELTRGGAAERAGLALGDEIIEVDSQSVVELGPRETMLVITQRPAGATVTLTVLRGGEPRKLVVTVRGAS
jgi:RNA polymerase sigma-70 factor (ECF subfamily)